MKVLLSQFAGPCSDIEKAISFIEHSLENKQAVFLYGELAHNELLLNDLVKKGAKIISKAAEAKDGSIVVVRSHGIPKGEMNELKARKIILIDETCHCVFLTQKIIENASKDCQILLIGNENHPEVKCLQSYGNEKVIVLPDLMSIENLPKVEKAALLCKNTELDETVNKFAEKLQKKVKHLKVFRTICPEIIKRRQDAKELAEKVDAMLVLGSKKSYNTLKQVEELSALKPTHLIENESQLDRINFNGIKSIGIVTAVSVPNFFVKRIAEKLGDF